MRRRGFLASLIAAVAGLITGKSWGEEVVKPKHYRVRFDRIYAPKLAPGVDELRTWRVDIRGWEQ